MTNVAGRTQQEAVKCWYHAEEPPLLGGYEPLACPVALGGRGVGGMEVELCACYLSTYPLRPGWERCRGHGGRGVWLRPVHSQLGGEARVSCRGT